MAGRQVLIVEDTRELGRMLHSALLTLDPTLTVQVVPSAEEALFSLTRQRADLVIADIHLPGMSGLEMLQRLHQRTPETPCILITALPHEGLAQQAQKAGAVRFLRKPLSLTTFLEAVAEVLGLGSAIAAPPATTPPQPAESGEVRLATRLAGLRQALGARTVCLLDDRGRVVAQAGEWLPGDFEKEWVAPMMATLSTAIKTSRLISVGAPRAVMAWQGEEVHLVLAPIGVFGLLLLLPGNQSAVHLSLAFEAVTRAVQDLSRILEEMGVPFHTVVTAPLPPEPPFNRPLTAEEEAIPEVLSLEDQPILQSLVQHLEQPPLPADPQAVDAFWEAALESESPPASASEALSYEQALRLGLAPNPEDEDETHSHG